jgi:hypothetical protein
MLDGILEKKCDWVEKISTIESKINENSWELEILSRTINHNWELEIKIKIGELITSVYAKADKRKGESYLYIISDWEIIDIDLESDITKNIKIVYLQENESSEIYVNSYTRFNNFLNSTREDIREKTQEVLKAS